MLSLDSLLQASYTHLPRNLRFSQETTRTRHREGALPPILGLAQHHVLAQHHFLLLSQLPLAGAISHIH